MSGRLPPTRDDWGDLDVDPDVEYGHRLFGGKTVAEATPLFADNPMERAAELRFTTAPVFNYYIFCFADHLLAPESIGASDAASCFLRLVLARLQAMPTSVIPIWRRLGPTVAAVAARQSFYDADTSIYGSFADLWSQIDALAPRAEGGGA